MNTISNSIRRFSSGLGYLSILFIIGGFANASAARAEKLVIADFSSKGAGKLAYQSRIQMIRALQKQGARFIPYKSYQAAARRMQIQGQKSLSPAGIMRLSNQVKADGVITGRAWRAGKRFRLLIAVYNSAGKLVISKNYNFRWQAMPASVAAQLSSAIMSKLGGDKTLLGLNLSEQKTSSQPPETISSPKEETSAQDWTQDRSTSQPVQAETTSRAASVGRMTRGRGSVPDILLAAGMSGNFRSGLVPLHESSLYPGLRVDARFFLCSLIDTPIVRDFALGGMFNNGFLLEYGLQGGSEKWSSSMRQWQAELTYRLAFNDAWLKPAVLIRLGYGSTQNTIDTDNEAAVDASYSYPYTGVDVHITVWKPFLRFFIGGGLLFPVSGSEELSGSGWGTTARTGFEATLYAQLHAAIGYEMWQFKSLEVTDNEITDTFQSFFLRVGWSHH